MGRSDRGQRRCREIVVGGMRKIRLSTGLRATNQSLGWVGTRLGIFAKYGLDASFPGLEVGGPASVEGLLRGDWDVAQTGVVPIAEAVLKGEDAVIVMRDSMLDDMIVIMAPARVSHLGQLDGKRVGVLTDAYSGQTGVFARLAIEREGAIASYVGLGTYRKIFEAVRAGEIDAGALPMDYKIIEEHRDRWTFFDTHSLRVPAIIATTRRAIEADREFVRDAVRAFAASMQHFRRRDPAVVPPLQTFLDVESRTSAARLRDLYAYAIPAVPRPSLLDGMADLGGHFLDRYPAAAELGESDIVDFTIVEELDQEGFFTALL